MIRMVGLGWLCVYLMALGAVDLLISRFTPLI